MEAKTSKKERATSSPACPGAAADWPVIWVALAQLVCLVTRLSTWTAF